MREQPKILVIEGDDNLSRALAARLEQEGFRPQSAHNRMQADALLRNLRFDAIVIDAQLPGGGERCFYDARPHIGSTPVIFTIEAGQVDQAIRLLKAGAVDCVQKPYDFAGVIARLQTILTRPVRNNRSWPDPVMLSPLMRALGQRLERLAATRICLVVTGESGSGKEVVTRYLHRLSSRAGDPFIEISCASLMGGDGEKLLFGELVRSAQEPAGRVKVGVLEEVGGGTLLFNDIEDMPEALQNRLAQTMDEGRFRRLGDVASLSFEGRIVAATELSSTRLREKLRPNLYHRLAVVEIEVPPLRQRRADLPVLVEALLREVTEELRVPPRAISSDALLALNAHDWPGNVRELRNRLLRAASFARSGKISVEDLFSDMRIEEAIAAPLPTLEEVRTDAERQRIIDALASNNGRIGQTARSLGISRVTLWGKIKKLGISNSAGDYSEPSSGETAASSAGSSDGPK